MTASAGTTKRWQLALHPKAYDGRSNIAMYVGTTQAELDFNGTNLVSKVPKGSTVKLCHKLTPISEKHIKNVKVITKARTWEEMAANAA